MLKRRDPYPEWGVVPVHPIERAEAIARFTAVMEQPGVRLELERLMRSLWPEGPDGGIRIRVLRSHRDRCTFEVAYGPEDGGRKIIAKAYEDDNSHVFAAMESVVAAGFGPTEPFSIAMPLAYLHPAQVLLQEKVPGTEAVEIFQRDPLERQVEAARRCGAWLGLFHMRAPPQGHLKGPDRLRHGMRYWAGELRAAGEPLASRAERLLQNLEAAAPGVLNELDLRPSHGTYMADHVVLSGTRTASIDLDEYHIADPAMDLAWFILSLERLGLETRGSLRGHDRVIEEFLREYARFGPQSGLSHLPFFKAFMYLYEAHQDAYRRTIPIREWSEIMLEEGIDSLRWEPDRDDAQPPTRS